MKQSELIEWAQGVPSFTMTELRAAHGHRYRQNAGAHLQELVGGAVRAKKLFRVAQATYTTTKPTPPKQCSRNTFNPQQLSMW